MKKLITSIIFLLNVTFIYSQTVYPNKVDGEIYVKFTKAALKEVSKDNPNNIPLSKLTSITKISTKYGVTRVYKPFYQADDDAKLPYILKFEFSQIKKVDDFIEELNQIAGIEYAEKVNLNKLDVTPNDPTFGAHLTQINAANAWNVFNGTTNGNSNITVAIVDNAVAWTHPDLVANTFTNTLEIANNGIDDDGNGYIDDLNGWDAADNDNNTIPSNNAMNHGTHCAGIAGARTNNSLGVASIGWNIKIIPVKCQNNTGNTTGIVAGYQGIIYAAKMKARVISCSWGGMSTASASEQSVIDYAWNRGCLVICAAGNDNNQTLHYPAAYNNVFCVASVSSTNVKSSFSCYGTWVDICAPGENIMSTGPNNTYFSSSGTSMATPLVAGLAGLMLSKCNFMTATDVINCIKNTSANIYTITGNSTYVTGSKLGQGRIEAFAAMNCAASFLNYAPIANFFTLTQNVCPNVPVAFIDSSMYAPTNFTWTFQGGTPATSTSSNPSIQWATPGTYSVSLTVSNANGSNTKNKTSYITIAGPVNLPLAEGFQTGQLLPPNWTAYNVNNDVNYYALQTGVGGFGTSTACVIYDNYNLDAAPDRDELRTPKYQFNNVVNAKLRFDVAYKQFDNTYSDTLEVRLSTNCGSSWTSIYSKGGATLSSSTGTLQANSFTPTATEWRKDTIDISTLTAGQGNVMFSFVNRGHYGQSLYLDNINLAFPTPTVNFTMPSASVCAGTSISFTNTSLGAASYTWTMNGGSPAVSNATNAVVVYSSPGIYSITLTGINGTSTASITQTINVISNPTITVNSPSVCLGNSVILTASGANTYTWVAGPTTASISVTPTTTTLYTVYGSNSGICSSSKTATVQVITGPTITVNSPSICTGNSTTLTASGATNYTWSSNQTTSSISVSPAITTTYTVIGNNGGTCSTTKTTTVFVTPNPTIAVNNQTICTGGSATIAATGASSYLWSTGFTGNPLIINPTVNTTYTVTGTSLGCSNTKTVSVTIGSSLSVLISASNNSVCAGGASDLTASGATSYTWSTASNTGSITVNPNTSTTYSVIGSNNSCFGTATININVISTPSINLSTVPSNTICAGKTVTITASGNYTNFIWVSPTTTATSFTATPSSTSSYTVYGSGAGGCNTSSIITINVKTNPVTAVTFTNANCTNSCSGAANAVSTLGTFPYTYSLSGTSCTTVPCTNLCAGNYTMFTTDAFGCKSTNTFSIVAPLNNLQSVITSTNASCSTCSTGIANVAVTGGVGPYTYSWIPTGGNSALASNLAPACYTVVVNDTYSCSVSTSTCIGFSTGIQNQTVNNSLVLIYPNPANNWINIEYNGEFNYTLFNSLGQIITENKNNSQLSTISLNNIAKGIYLIEVETGNETLRKKLIIE